MSPATTPGLNDEASLRERLLSARQPMAEGLFPEVLALLQPTHAAALHLGLPALAGEAALMLAQSAFNADDGAAAAAWCQRALDAARRAGDRAREAAAGVVLASVRAQGNDAAGAILAVVGALACADDHMTESARLTVHVGICATYGSLGMSSQSLAAARHARRALPPGDTTSNRAIRVLLNLVSAGVEAIDDAVLAGDDTTALRAELLPLLPAIEQAATGFEPGWMRFSCTHAMGMVLRHAGRLDEARAWLQQAVHEAGPVAPAERHGAWLTLGLLHEQQGDAASARHAAERAAELVADDPAYALERASAYALRAMATTQRLLGRHEQALALERRRHAQVQRNLLHALDAQVQGLTRRLDEQSLMLQNVQLRELNDQLARSVQDMSHAARTDALTGLLNRRAMEDAFVDLRRSGHRVCVLMIDVDHFKRVNDGHSHAVGDAVLRQVALLMADALRAPDRLGRFGGEEFVALLAGADLLDARGVAERLRLRVQDFDWSQQAPGLSITVSLGLAMAQPDDGFEQALSRADTQLYRAKAAGRNRLMADE